MGWKREGQLNGIELFGISEQFDAGRSVMEMTKSEVKNALDEIRDMSDEEIADNGNYIRKVAEEAYALIKNLERR